MTISLRPLALTVLVLLSSGVSASTFNLRARRLDDSSPCTCYCSDSDSAYNVVAAKSDGSETATLMKVVLYATGATDCIEVVDSLTEYDAEEVIGSTNTGYCDTECRTPSASPSISAAPTASIAPSPAPSHSGAPTVSPSPSEVPSLSPSLSPSVSLAPSTSSAPSTAPSISQMPSMSPSICAGTTQDSGAFEGCFKGLALCVTIACQDADCCTGNSACEWSDDSSVTVCPGSCNGRQACYMEHKTSSVIMKNSCNGISACKDLGQGEDYSTQDADCTSCASVSGRVSRNSCDGALACTRTTGQVGQYSCNGTGACTNKEATSTDNTRRLNPELNKEEEEELIRRHLAGLGP